jgi:hypothetical protein
MTDARFRDMRVKALKFDRIGPRITRIDAEGSEVGQRMTRMKTNGISWRGTSVVTVPLVQGFAFIRVIRWKVFRVDSRNSRVLSDGSPKAFS